MYFFKCSLNIKMLIVFENDRSPNNSKIKGGHFKMTIF